MLQEIFQNTSFVAGLSLIISVVIPLVVMICTLKSQAKQFSAELASRDKQFAKFLRETDENHKETLLAKADSDRISQLPFLLLTKPIHIGKRNEHLLFTLEIKNLGNGVALDVEVITEPGIGLPVVCSESIVDELIEYHYTDLLSTNVLPINEKASFEIMVCWYKGGMELSKKDDILVGQVDFTIRFKDAFYNEYEQKYMFQYKTDIGIGRTESYLPVLIRRE